MIRRPLGTVGAPSGAPGALYTDFPAAGAVILSGGTKFTGIAFHIDPGAAAAAAAGNDVSLKIEWPGGECIVHDGVTYETGHDEDGNRIEYNGPVTASLVNGGANSPYGELVFLQNGERLTSEPTHVTATSSGGSSAGSSQVEGRFGAGAGVPNPVVVGGQNATGVAAVGVAAEGASMNVGVGSGNAMAVGGHDYATSGGGIFMGVLSVCIGKGGTAATPVQPWRVLNAGKIGQNGYDSGSIAGGAAIDSGVLSHQGVDSIGLVCDNSAGVGIRNLTIGWYKQDAATLIRQIVVPVAAGAIQDVVIGLGATSAGGAANTVLGHPIAPCMRFQLAAGGAAAAQINSMCK